VLMLDTAYSGYLKEADFPELKVPNVRSLLDDLGRLG
jgi:hypothetical protein